MRIRGSISVGLVGCCALLVSGCGRSVTVEPLPISTDAVGAACADLVSALPTSIAAGRSWQVLPSPDSNKAWGSPAVVLRCGDNVPQPGPTEQLVTVDSVDWRVVPLSEGDRFTTVARTPGVEVTVPDAYQPTAAVLAEISATVANVGIG